MSEEIITVWKCTRANGLPIYSSKALPQPRGKKPGAWHDVGCNPIPCVIGVHGCRTLVDMLRGGWLNEELYVAELRGPIVNAEDKVAGRSGRLCYRIEAWNEQTARLFAADCAETVAHLHPIVAPTVRAVRRCAFGLASPSDLVAAEDAAEVAAEVAAGTAAWVAVWVAAGTAARDAAWNVARTAAWDAAMAAAGGAAWKRMALRLHDYLTGKVDIEAIRRSVE